MISLKMRNLDPTKRNRAQSKSSKVPKDSLIKTMINKFRKSLSQIKRTLKRPSIKSEMMKMISPGKIKNRISNHLNPTKKILLENKAKRSLKENLKEDDFRLIWSFVIFKLMNEFLSKKRQLKESFCFVNRVGLLNLLLKLTQIMIKIMAVTILARE